MVNKSKAKGTAAETRVVNFMLAAGFSAHRVALSGAVDKGDIHIVSPDGSFVIAFEVKAGKQTQNVGRGQLQEWIDEAHREKVNAQAANGFLIIAKFGCSVADYQVWSADDPNADGLRFWYLDEFLERGVLASARKEV